MPEWLRDWWPLIALAYTTVLMPAAGWIIRTGLVPRAEFEQAKATEASSRAAADQQLADRIADGARRLDRVETDMRHLPDKEVTHRMELTLAALKMEISVLSERLHPVAAISDRLQEFMLEKGAR
ncbi:hypothetical protein C3941_09350 [Kaistia algarum]|uniref:hypothetical protein n=1 Tax=Kaistia algarum TaxID=2083279 RepID=UPI000CE85290|nr:hypothetical protein [Kaistia algarum]MCX5512265.1 hypothetical protein [Kaistia algarum]PPE80356.1 hypothetical protein C3941_09350 [Kaistia algarum]